MTRRKFFSWIANSSIATTLGGFVVVVLKFMTPNVLFEPPTSFKIGKPEDYPLDSVTLIPERKLFVVNSDDEYSVISATCTHLGCSVKIISDGQFHCPCHGSKFDDNGNVIKGPAQTPLPHFEVTLSRNGYLIVDIKKIVDTDYRLIVD